MGNSFCFGSLSTPMEAEMGEHVTDNGSVGICYTKTADTVSSGW